ncbi:MAG TPA: glycosyltransferase family 2 protein [Elusimicrobiota bacterium]|nr:glycosyltransferase family 2 protein [Elusimicrobiota bacterium]
MTESPSTAPASNPLKICIFIPCYNAASTLPKLIDRIPAEIKQEVRKIFMIDNASPDNTYLVGLAYREQMKMEKMLVFKNAVNMGYGGSQKLAYSHAIKEGFDLVVMLHGDAQYAPEHLPHMINLFKKDPTIDMVFGSRMRGHPLRGGMPIHRFLGNKVLTFMQNMFLGTHYSEFHSGYRLFRTSALKKIPLHLLSNDYHFDTEIMILFIKQKLKITECPIQTHYGDEKNYVNIWRYAVDVLVATFCYWLQKKGLRSYPQYEENRGADVEHILSNAKFTVY